MIAFILLRRGEYLDPGMVRAEIDLNQVARFASVLERSDAFAIEGTAEVTLHTLPVQRPADGFIGSELQEAAEWDEDGQSFEARDTDEDFGTVRGLRLRVYAGGDFTVIGYDKHTGEGYETEIVTPRELALAKIVLPMAGPILNEFEAEAGLAIWEEMLERHRAASKSLASVPPLSALWEWLGASGMRLEAVRLAPFVARVWELVPEAVRDGGSFDWDFVPALLDVLSFEDGSAAITTPDEADAALKIEDALRTSYRMPPRALQPSDETLAA